MWDRPRQAWAALLLANLLVNVLSSPIYVPHFISGSTGRNIRHLPCVSRRTGETGVCMFAFTCAKANGTHLGTCIDRFYFGSCCKIEEEPDVFPQDNSIEDGPPSRPFLTTHGPIESNDIPEYISRPRPTTEKKAPAPTFTTTSTIITETVTQSTPGFTSTVRETTKLATKRPSTSFETTTQQSRISTFQTVQNVSEESSTKPAIVRNATTSQWSQKPIGTTGTSSVTRRPTKPTSVTGRPPVTETATRISITTQLSSKPSHQITKKPSTIGRPSQTTTAQLATKKPVPVTTYKPTETTTLRPSSLSPSTTVSTRRPTQPTTRPVTTTTQKSVPATRFPPRNTTTGRPATQATTKRPVTTTKRPPTSPSTKRPTVTTKKPSSPTKRPTSPVKPTGTTSGLTTLPPLTTRPLSSASTKGKPTLTTVTESTLLTTQVYTTESLTTVTERPTTSSTTKKTTQQRVTTKPTTVRTTTLRSVSTTLKPKPTRVSTTTTKVTKAPVTTTTERSRPVVSTLGSTVSGTRPRPTIETTRPRPTESTRPKPTVETTKPRPTESTRPKPTESTRPKPTETTRPRPTESTRPKPSLETTRPRPTVEATKPRPTIESLKPIPTLESTKPRPTVESTKPRPTVESTKPRPTETTIPLKPVTKLPITTPTTILDTTLGGTVSVPALETKAPISTSTFAPVPSVTENEGLEEIPQTTFSPGLVTWSSSSDTVTKAPEVPTTSTITSVQEQTETEWSPITTPDGWIMIQSPTTENTTDSPIEATEKPEEESTPTVTFATSTTEATTTEEVTKRPTPSTSPPPISGVTIDSELPVPMETLNMTDYKQVCGRRLFPESRIVGGKRSSFGKWPWQISLRQWRTSTYLHKCGAALLNENWAITAAHCVENVPPSDLLLRIGEHDLANEEEPYGFQERRVQIVASHPQFDPRTFEYDLALLRFYEPLLPFQPNVLPICLPDDDENYVGRTAFVTGWGRLFDEGPLPSILQEVAVPVINNTVCESMYRNAGYIEHIPNIFICAGWRNGGYDSCEGDSGGPMVIQRARDKRWILAGVISWGIGCAVPNQPGVYTRISEFREWINQILQF